MSLPPFQQLLDTYGPDVHRLLVASVGQLDADDCYQETWMAALRAYPRLTDASNLRSWLLTIASRKAIDHARRARRRPIPVESLPERAAPPVEEPDRAIWAHVRRLPPKQRTALALRFALDAGYDDVAGVMGTSQEAARRNVHEALKRLRLEYQHD